MTYLPVPSISASPAGGRRAVPALIATGSSDTICVIWFPSITMSFGPSAGVPLPSITVAPRMTRRRARYSMRRSGSATNRRSGGRGLLGYRRTRIDAERRGHRGDQHEA